MEARDANAQIRRNLFAAIAADPETNLFDIEPKYLGFGAFCHPMSGADPSTSEKFNALLNLSFPTKSLLQFSFYASPDLSETLEEYARQTKTDSEILRSLTRDRIDYLRRAAKDPVDRVSSMRVHDCQIVIAAKIPISGVQATDTERRRANELRQNFMQTLTSIGVSHTALTPERYLRFMQTVFNQRPSATWRESSYTHWEETVPLSEQILDHDTSIKVDRYGLWLGDTSRVRIMTPKRRPEAIAFGTSQRYLGDIMSGSRGIRENTLITVNIAYPDHESKRSSMDNDMVWSTKQAEGRMARLKSEFGLRKKSLDLLSKAVEAGDRIVQSYMSIAVFADSEEQSIAAAANAKTYMRELGFQFMDDSFMALPLFMQMLPFAADDAIIPHIKKYKTSATRHVVPFLPVLGAWRGTGTPIITLLSRDGQLMPMSLFDSQSAYSAIVVAQTGKGKSFFVNHLLERMIATGGRAWVIDVGGSYKQLCELLGGQYMSFGADSNICLNPFSRVTNWEEEGDIIAGIIAAMATPTGHLDSFQLAGLKKHLSSIWAQHGASMTMDIVIDRLMQDSDPRGRITDIAHQLFPFSSQGAYGRWFNGVNNFNPTSSFIVCELEELKSRKHAQRVILMQLMAQIQADMYLGDRSQRKALIIDECWDTIGSSPEVKDFIVAAYRRARKANGSCVTITQSIADYFQGEGTLAIMENSPNMYLLGQKAESIAYVKETKRLAIGEYGFKMLESVHTVPGAYSEILCSTEMGMGVGRLVVSPFQQKLYSTTPDEVVQINRLRAQGYTLTQAINILIGVDSPTPAPPIARALGVAA
jgi:conjugal transfer ATP-binding protein TraC